MMSVKNAIVLGNNSIAVDNALSVGSATNKRRIVFVANPEGEYDAVNKKYVDDRGIKIAGSDRVSKLLN